MLLDDPLSAVDSHVGKHLFHKAIRGYLTNKLVILTANQLQYLPYADLIIFLSEGDVTASGNFEELMKTNASFREQMNRFSVTGRNEEESEEEQPVQPAQKTENSEKTPATSSDTKAATEAVTAQLQPLKRIQAHWWRMKTKPRVWLAWTSTGTTLARLATAWCSPCCSHWLWVLARESWVVGGSLFGSQMATDSICRPVSYLRSLAK